MFFTSQTHSARDIMTAVDASMAVIEFTADGRILNANANFLQVMDYRLGDLQGQHHSIFCDKAFVASEDYARFWQNLARGQTESGTFKRFTRGGKVVWLEASYTPVRDRSGKITKVVKIAADVTAAKLADIDNRGKVEAINRSQAVIEFTPSGDVLTANDNFLTLLGYRLDEVTGKHHAIFCDRNYVASEDYRRFWDELKAGRFQSGEFKRIGKGGRDVYIQAIYSPILDDTGAVVKVVKFATDMTDAVKKRMRNDGLGHTINEDLGGVLSQVAAASSMTTNASTASAETGAIINSVAAASEELSHSVHEIAHSMNAARGGVESVFKHAETANAQAASLDRSAASMNNVVTLIQDIAGQINLLALNATIESARAGEAGKGFAVVASEVKNLANQAANSTKTISTEITNMQAVTGDVVEALNLISTSLTEVMNSVTSVASAIEQQTAVTGEISHNMQSAVSAIDQINEGLARVTQTFTTVVEASDKVKASVETLVA